MRRFLEEAGKVLRKVKGAAEEVVDEVMSEADLGRLIDQGRQLGTRLTVQAFPTGPGFRFPEADDPRLANRWDFGVAFSGGGTRSASCSLGQMRALHRLGLDRRIRYIGAISGGSWFAVPYTYLPSRIPDDQWLGLHQEPSTLDWEVARRIDGMSGTLARQLTRSEVLFVALREVARKHFASRFRVTVPVIDVEIGLTDFDEIFSQAIESVFLDELGLAGDRYAAWTASADVADIVARHRDQTAVTNPRLTAADFVAVDKDRPYLVVNGAMNQDAGKVPDSSTRSVASQLGLLAFDHVEFTPRYSGVPTPGRGRLGFATGGGYVENIGFDTWLTVPKSGDRYTVSPGKRSHRFSLRDMMGTSGAAPAYVVHALKPDWGPGLPSSILDVFPEFCHWPVVRGSEPVTVERPFGDGGYVDNYGIVPLLKRGVSSIIVFVNTDTPLEEGVDGWQARIAVDRQLPTFFGVRVPDVLADDLMSPSVFTSSDRMLGAGQGQVFAGGYGETIRGLLQTKALANTRVRTGPAPVGRLSQADVDRLIAPEGSRPATWVGKIRGPTYHLGRYETVDNAFFGIKGGRRVRVLWVYNEASRAWAEQLPPSARREVGREGTALEGFPHIPTFLSGGTDERPALRDRIVQEVASKGWVRGIADAVLAPIAFVDLHPEQVNLLSNLTAFSLLALEPVIREDLLRREHGLGAPPVSLQTLLGEGDSLRAALRGRSPSLRALASSRP